LFPIGRTAIAATGIVVVLLVVLLGFPLLLLIAFDA
jgi:hypothetical protein